MENPFAASLHPANLLPAIKQALMDRGVDEAVVGLAVMGIGLVLMVALAVLANWIAKAIILRLIDRFVKRTPWSWDDLMHEHQVFTRLSHLAPALVIQVYGTVIFADSPLTDRFVTIGVQIYVLAILLIVASAVLNTLLTILQKRESTAGTPVKGFIQAVKLVLVIIAGILALSIVFGRSPIFFLSGIGAMTAVMLLIFRDALLGLVAGVMISVNQLVRVGDWIEMPSNGADGNVVDVSLTTVKVRNWDRTYTTIPSYDLISKSFKNWRGMFENQGRRIKRALYIDTQTIDFVDEDRLVKLLKIKRLRPYLEKKRDEIAEANKLLGTDLGILCNGRRLTNLGTFRAYCVAYLREHAGVKQDELLIVRHLQPTEHGLPLEIYCFTSDTAWVAHEATQADIFDHFLSIIEEFGLRLFQDPSGRDLREALRRPAPRGPRPPEAGDSKAS